MKKEPVLVSMRDNKKTLFEAGRDNYFRYIALMEEFEQLKLTNVSLINSLRWVLKNMPAIQFLYEDDAIEDAVIDKPKKREGVEIQ